MFACIFVRLGLFVVVGGGGGGSGGGLFIWLVSFRFISFG